MAKMAVINREQKRREMVAKYAPKRALLIAAIENTKLSDEERSAARLNCKRYRVTQVRFVCAIVGALTGRPRGTFRKFGLGRIKVREFAMRGEIPGIVKASW